MNEEQKVAHVLSLFAQAGRRPLTAEALQTFLAWRHVRTSLGAAMVHGELHRAWPLEMAMLFATTEPGPLPGDDDLWRLGRAAARRAAARRRANARDLAREEDDEAGELAHAQRLLDAAKRS